jgi:hypothetical protein
MLIDIYSSSCEAAKARRFRRGIDSRCYACSDPARDTSVGINPDMMLIRAAVSVSL